MHAQASEDTQTRKKVLRQLTYGIYILTAADRGQVAAGTVTWLSQASRNPPLVMVGLRDDSYLKAVVERSGAFAVNIVSASHRDVARAFFRGARETDARSINDYEFEPGPATGAPLLICLPAWFEARVTDTVSRGDHTVFVAEIVQFGARSQDMEPLMLHDTPWSYGG